MEGRQKYFDEALSDFVHDAASGGAIRHLVDLGYSLTQIMQALSYPTPRERVQKTVYRYMLESGMLLKMLPGLEEGVFTLVSLQARDRGRLFLYLQEKINQNGRENVYLSCPFGIMQEENSGKAAKELMRSRLSCLNKREQDYILGIPWENSVMYHRLNDRMREIGWKLIEQPELGCCYFFLKTKEMVTVKRES